MGVESLSRAQCEPLWGIVGLHFRRLEHLEHRGTGGLYASETESMAQNTRILNMSHSQAKPDFNTKVSMANLKVWGYHNFVNIFV
jgi:hypothetical protein